MGKIKTEQKILVPRHIAVIPDGNRRWAKGKGLPSVMGHKKGFETMEMLIEQSRNMGVKALSGWGFSTENWKRSKDEIDYLFEMGRKWASKFKKKCIENKIRFVHLGRKDRLPQDLVNDLIEMEERTKHFDSFTFAGAADYGGHNEILRAVKKLEDLGLEVTEENIEQNLDTAQLPPLDLIIRTGGEKRLSGFMSWQSAYAEYYFSDKFLPEFGPKDLELAVLDFSNRDRRYGGDTKGLK